MGCGEAEVAAAVLLRVEGLLMRQVVAAEVGCGAAEVAAVVLQLQLVSSLPRPD
jgi:hypothetical protein